MAVTLIYWHTQEADVKIYKIHALLVNDQEMASLVREVEAFQLPMLLRK